jgi:hypothetical protein
MRSAMAPVWCRREPEDETRRWIGVPGATQACQSTAAASVSSSAKVRASKRATRTTTRVAARNQRLAA